MQVEIIKTISEFTTYLKTLTSGVIFLDVKRNFMFLSDDKFPNNMAAVKLYDKTNIMSLATIERIVKHLAEYIKLHSPLIIGADLKDSFVALKQILGKDFYNYFSNLNFKRLDDIKVKLSLAGQFAQLKRLELLSYHSEADFEEYVRSRAKLLEFIVREVYIDPHVVESSGSTVYGVIMRATFAFVDMETRGIYIPEDKLTTPQLIEQYNKQCDVISGKKLIMPKFNIMGAATGRTSSNIHSLSKAFKKLVAPLNPTNKVIRLDYVAGELRTLAHLSGDEQLIKLLTGEEDVHTVYGDSIGTDREKAKAVLFAIVNGMRDKGLTSEFKLSVDDAKAAVVKAKKLMPTAFKWIDSIQEQAKQDGKVVNCFGRTRFLADSFKESEWSGKVRASNALIQGTLSDIKLDVLYDIQRMLPDGLLAEIHDEIIVEVNCDFEIEKLVEIMCNPKSIKLRCPLEVKYEVNG